MEATCPDALVLVGAAGGGRLPDSRWQAGRLSSPSMDPEIFTPTTPLPIHHTRRSTTSRQLVYVTSAAFFAGPPLSCVHSTYSLVSWPFYSTAPVSTLLSCPPSPLSFLLNFCPRAHACTSFPSSRTCTQPPPSPLHVHMRALPASLRAHAPFPSSRICAQPAHSPPSLCAHACTSPPLLSHVRATTPFLSTSTFTHSRLSLLAHALPPLSPQRAHVCTSLPFLTNMCANVLPSPPHAQSPPHHPVPSSCTCAHFPSPPCAHARTLLLLYVHMCALLSLSSCI